MARPARQIEDHERADLVAIDAMLTLADANLRSALEGMRRLRRQGVPVRQMAAALGLSERACRMDGTGLIESAQEKLELSRKRGTERRPSRNEERYVGSFELDQTDYHPPRS